jgi:hypothetical protein
MQIIDGNTNDGKKKFALINTTDYNLNNNFQISIFTIDEAEELGFDELETEQISQLLVGEQAVFEYGIDAQVVRLG